LSVIYYINYSQKKTAPGLGAVELLAEIPLQE
jgi:hypothetical protein